MKKHILLLLLAGSIQFASAQTNAGSFTWLVGTWEMKKEKSTIRETWKMIGDSIYEGSSSIVKPNGDVRVLENIRIIQRGDNWYYVPTVNGQNKQQPVYFTIVTINEGKLIAEDKTHDFPKRITYELTEKDSLHAWIDDGNDPPGKRSDFYYSRKK